MNMLPYSGFPALPDKMEDMHKQLVALGLNDVEALTARIKKCEDWVDNVEETEQTGNPVEFQNALAVPATSLETTINAIQDLHGYDHPWVGGADVNKGDFTDGYNLGVDGLPYAYEGRCATVNPITIVADTTYYATKFGTGTGFIYSVFDSEDVLVRRETVTSGSALNVSGGTYFYICAYDGTISAIQPMLTIGSVPTAYTPYSNICPISGRTAVTITNYDSESNTATVTVQLGQTVYGGTLNVTTGVLTVEWISIVPTEVASVLYDSGLGLYYWIVVSDVSSINGANVISDSFKGESVAAVGNCYISGQGHHILVIPVDQTLNTKALASAWVAANAPQFVYKLATPTTIQLTPTQLQMLKGYNRVSSEDADSLTVKAYTGGPWEPITRAIKKLTNKTKTTKKRRK